MSFTRVQLDAFEARGIDPQFAEAYGFVPVANMVMARGLAGTVPKSWINGFPGLLCPWVSPTTGQITYQLRPDRPQEDEDGRPKKYVWPNGVAPHLHAARLSTDPGRGDSLLLVEGTFQTAAVARYAPPTTSVVGMVGCWGWSHESQPLPDLEVMAGRHVVVILDADLASNSKVYRAGQGLATELQYHGAASIKFAVVPASGRQIKAGIDDVLGSRSLDARSGYLGRMVESAVPFNRIRKPSKDEESRLLKEKARAADKERALAEGRPMVSLVGDRLAVRIALQEAIDDKFEDTFYMRGRELVERQEARLHQVDQDRLVARIQDAARTGRPISNPLTDQTGWEDMDPSRVTLGALLGDHQYWPELDSIVETPFVRPDGTVCSSPGYDEQTKTYLHIDPKTLERMAIPDNPSAEDVQSAVKLMADGWMRDFLFETEQDRVMALALVLTPLVRQMFPTAPLFVLDGNRMSTGKGKLMSAVGILVTGRPQPLNPMPRAEDEFRKQVTSLFLSGSTLFAWDEIEVVGGRILAQLLTGAVWSDRELGASQIASIPNRATMMGAGNSLEIRGDLARRVVRIRLFSEAERPQDRDTSSFYCQPSLEEWTSTHRPELLSAAFTLIRAWEAAGQPYSGPRDFGSFEGWQRVVGGILEVAGMELDLDPTRGWADQADDDQSVWVEHLSWLHEEFGSSSFLARESIERMRSKDGPVPLLGNWGERIRRLDPSDPSCVKALGELYRHHTSRWDDGLRIRGDLGHRKIMRWKVETRAERDAEESAESSVWSPPSPEGACPPGNRGDEEVQTGVGRAHARTRTARGETRTRIPPVLEGMEVPEEPKNPTLLGTTEEYFLEESKNMTEKKKALRGPTGTASASNGGGTRGGAHAGERTGATTPRRSSPGYLYTTPWEGVLFRNPADALLDSLSQPMVSSCPDCGTQEVLVDDLWFACPNCAPATAARGGLQ